jgi:hypothetical protein
MLALCFAGAGFGFSAGADRWLEQDRISRESVHHRMRAFIGPPPHALNVS